MNVPVDVLIVNFKTPELVRASVDRLAGPGVSIYVWDNSGDVPSDLTGPGVELHGEGRNLFYAEASNRLYAKATSSYVLLLNPDVELHRAQLTRLVDDLVAQPDAWGSAPRLVGTDGSDQHYVRRLPTVARVIADRIGPARRLLRSANESYWYADLSREADVDVEQPAAACLLLRRDFVGDELFDPSYRLFFNDTDLARRMAVVGRCRYLGSVAVTHLGGESISRLDDRAWIREEYDRAYWLYCRRNLRAWPALAPAFALRWLAMRLHLSGPR